MALVGQFNDADRGAKQLVGDLSERQLNWRPGPDRWSVVECLGHLNLYGSALLPGIDTAISQARANGWYRQQAPHVGFLARRMIADAESPVRRKRRARPEQIAAGEQPLDVVLPAFLDLNRQFTERIAACSGLDIGRPCVALPGTIVFKPNLYELLLFIAAHERRHLRQAQSVREEPGFPRRVGPPPVTRPLAER